MAFKKILYYTNKKYLDLNFPIQCTSNKSNQNYIESDQTLLLAAPKAAPKAATRALGKKIYKNKQDFNLNFHFEKMKIYDKTIAQRSI